MTVHADGRYVGRRRTLEILAATDVARIHEASLDVLADVGVMFHSQRALDVLEAHGATVDRETTVAKIPAAAVEEALRDAAADASCSADARRSSTCRSTASTPTSPPTAAPPSCATPTAPCGRAPSRTCTTRPASWTACPTSRPPRPSSRRRTRPEESRVLHEFDACMRASRKHSIVVSHQGRDGGEAAHPHGRGGGGRVGGAQGPPARSPSSSAPCRPLHQERFGMELAFALAEAGIPMMLYPMPILGATAPVTPAGTAVVNNTEILAAITAVQLACPGAKIVHAGGPTALYMRTGAYFANVPEALLLRGVQAQMAAFYGMPAGLGWGGTKAKLPDAQAAYENTLGLLLELPGRRGLPLRRRPARQRLADEPRGAGHRRRGLRHGHAPAQGRRGRPRDAGGRPHQAARLQGRLPVRAPDAQARARALAGAPRRDRHLRELAAGRRAQPGGQGARRRRRHPRGPAPEFPDELGRAFDEIIAAAESGRL